MLAGCNRLVCKEDDCAGDDCAFRSRADMLTHKETASR